MPCTVIDGYNLLFREADADSASLEDLRDGFVRRVDAARAPGQRVTVVFDGKSGPRTPAPTGDGLEIRFSRSPRSADDLIVAIVQGSHRHQTVVLTHDRELSRRVRAAGGLIGDPREFFRASRPRTGSGGSRREKPPPPKGSEIDEWERLFGERDADP